MNIIANKNKVLLVIAVFIIALSFQLCLTSGFDFFWEDFDVFHVYWNEAKMTDYFQKEYAPNTINPSSFSFALGITKSYTENFFVPQRLFQIGFNSWSQVDRPYFFLTCDLMKVLFNNKVILYRIFKAIFFALNTCLIFLIVSRASRLLAILGIFLYMTSSEIWLSVVYTNHPLPYVQFAILLSIILFIKLTEKNSLRYRDAVFCYFLIMIASNYSVLCLGDGRYLAIIFFLTIFFFRIKQIKFHILPLIILLMMEVPVLGFVKNAFFSNSFLPLNFTTHANSPESSLSALKMAIRNYEYLQNSLGEKIIILLAIIIVINLIILIRRFLLPMIFKINKESKKIGPFLPILKERCFLFLLWFFAALFMIIRARGLRYDGPFDFQLFDLAYFIAPFIISLCYYLALMSSNMNKLSRAIFLVVCICLINAQLADNIKRLNKFRGGWGNFFCAWQNSEKYIDNTSKNALALTFTQMHYDPFVFYNSNNKRLNTQSRCEQSEFCDKKFIESKFKEGFEDIFVVGRDELKFRGDSSSIELREEKKIDGDSGDLYDRFKRFIRHPSKPLLYLYHFKIKKVQK